MCACTVYWSFSDKSITNNVPTNLYFEFVLKWDKNV